MGQFVEKLGIDWKLFLSQTVNFLLLLTVLRLFAYKPLLKIMKDRRRRIEEGLEKAAAADTKLHEINEIAKEKMKAAEQEALILLRQTEEKSKEIEAALLLKAHEKEAELIKSAERTAEGKREEARRIMEQEAAELVKQALVKTVELDPEKIDEALIKKAVGQITHSA